MKIFLVVLFSEKTPWKKTNLFTSKVTPNNYKIKGARSFKTEPFGKRFLTEHTLVDAILIGMFSNSFYSDVHVLVVVLCLLNI